MSKFNKFNPETAKLIRVHGDYSLYQRTDVEKLMIVKNNKVLILIDKLPSTPDEDQIDEEFIRWIQSFEFNAKRELKMLRESVAKKQRFIEEILAVFEE